MEGVQDVSYLMAFLGGLLIFFSPCILPLIPSYISYLTGISFKDLSGEGQEIDRGRLRKLTFLHSLMFVLGFSVIFVLLGTTASFLGGILLKYQDIVKKVGGVLIILFGLMIAGVLKPAFLGREKKIEYRKKNISYLGSFFVGATFAFAWTPCAGSILGAILSYAATKTSANLGTKLLSVFSLGLAVPFLLSALLVNSFIANMNKIKKYLRWINLAGGIILIIFGVLMLIGGIR